MYDLCILFDNTMTRAIACIFIAFGLCAAQTFAQTTDSVCNEPLGVGIGSGSVAILTASSEDIENQNTAEKGRLNSDRAWCGAFKNSESWIQAEFDAVKQVTGVITQKTQGGHRWVQEYKVIYSATNVTNFEVIKTKNDSDKIFLANTYRKKEVINNFSPIYAKWVRIHLVTWHKSGAGSSLPCLRFEVLGCPGVTTEEKKSTESEETTARTTTVDQLEMKSTTSGVTTDERKSTTPEETTVETTSVKSSSLSTDELEMNTEVKDKSTTYKPSDEHMQGKKYHFKYSNTCNSKEAKMVVNFKKKKKSSKTFRSCGID